MDDAQSIEIEDKDRVLAARRSLRIVVVRRDGVDAHAFDLLINLRPIVRGETAQNSWTACGERGVVVIGMLVADRDQVNAVNGRERVANTCRPSDQAARSTLNLF